MQLGEQRGRRATLGRAQRALRCSRSSTSPSSTNSSAACGEARRLLRDRCDAPVVAACRQSPASACKLAPQQREQARLAAAVRPDHADAPAGMELQCRVLDQVGAHRGQSSGSGTESRGRCLRFRRSRILAGEIRHICVNARRHGIRHNPHPLGSPGASLTRSARLDDPTQSAETGDASARCVVPARRDRARCLAARPGTDARRLHGASR